ncbi:efflux RND transporter periplasmic adaptor subunit [Clostridium colicanis]|uniref:Cation efflux system protein CusB n=1 Tax=Clostridium colicanis DSM 13634 TaxID=1121305 RepID=A0A151AKA0_9CLOT|nr:efflux RND transporter periplasmic adaptor subunit [Clostridium colicanis]KYH28005.1 cation efflux system protein CusB precursor [Clostridium colicanis DSM 13634]
MKKSYLRIISASLLAGLLLSGCKLKSSSDTLAASVQEEYTPVEVAKVKLDTIYNSTTITGKVDGKNDVGVFPKVAAKVTELSVKEGQHVKAGQTIAVLDKQDIQNRVEQAKASMDSAAVGVEQAKDSVNNASVAIKQAQASVASAAVGVEQAETALKQAKDSIKSVEAAYNVAKANYDANYEKIQNAKLNLERSKKLYEQGIISKVELEQAELAASDNSIKVLEAQLAQAKESYNQSSHTVSQAEVGLKQAQKAYEQAKLGVEQAKAAYNQANTGVKQAQAAYNQAKVAYDQAVKALQDAVITSPVDGVVYAVNVEKGEMASSAQPIVTIKSIDKVYVNVDVTEKLVTKLQTGSKINLKIPSVSDKKLTGVITMINPVANGQNNLYKVEIEVDNKEHKINSGMFAQVEFNTDEKKNVMVVNSEAVTDDNEKQIVYLEENGKAVAKEVKTGLDNGEYVEIKSGLKVNDRVIVKGQELVENGDKVKVVGGAK